jgi:DNA-binding transcriptional LysR family regulator
MIVFHVALQQNYLMKNLPALALLVAFETVARRRGFALAAAELNVTASAVSHQIARLETFLDVRLFDRTTAGVRLNASGEAYLLRVSAALSALRAASKDVKQGATTSLYVHAAPSFASLWLMPRLAEFSNAHPNIALALSASHVHSDFATGLIDLDIRYGTPRWPGLEVEAMFTEKVLPLASPMLLKRIPVVRVEDVLAMPLIQSTVSIVQWSDWLANQNIHDAPQSYALRFDRAQLSLDAAVQGLGVALESSTIAARLLSSGQLVPVFDTALALTIQGHYMVYPHRHAKREQVRVFIDWVRGQTRDVCDPQITVI